MIESGAEPNERGKDGWSVLHLAAHYSSAETVRALIEAGADPAARGPGGRLPADLAEENERVRGDPVFRILNKARSK